MQVFGSFAANQPKYMCRTCVHYGVASQHLSISPSVIVIFSTTLSFRVCSAGLLPFRHSWDQGAAPLIRRSIGPTPSGSADLPAPARPRAVLGPVSAHGAEIGCTACAGTRLPAPAARTRSQGRASPRNCRCVAVVSTGAAGCRGDRTAATGGRRRLGGSWEQLRCCRRCGRAAASSAGGLPIDRWVADKAQGITRMMISRLSSPMAPPPRMCPWVS